jgi:plasmid stabilization system protein ParE
MALEIVWTKRAEKGFDKIITYLEENWTPREVENFVQSSFAFIDLLAKQPQILAKSSKQKYVYRGPMDGHNILTYRLKPRKKQIELLNIRASKRKPLTN